MNPVQIFQSLINTENLQKASTVSLKPGQLLYGRVVKFMPNDTALIQIGNARLFAQLKASLTTEDSYWFEVRSNGDDGTQLKVVEGKGQNVPADFLLKHFQLPDTKQNTQLLQTFVTNNLPFTKGQLQTAASWIGHSLDIKKETALEWMIKKDLPFTKQTFQSLVAVQDSEPLSQQLVKIASNLENVNFSSLPTIQALTDKIATILGNHSVNELSTGSEVKHLLKSMIQTLGLEFESSLQLLSSDEKNTIETLQSLKPLLMGAISELGSHGRALEPLLNRITGMQLISQDLTGQMQQLIMQLPLTIGNRQADITLQWNGRKMKNGQIDPDYCRIFFYLDLQSLQQTVIDMQVQNRVVHVSVINDTKDLETIVGALTPVLKEKLNNIGYQLSFIHVVPPVDSMKMSSDQMTPAFFTKEFYQGVDVKI
ncbi:hypothetical protein [Neobacillus jeddahensis]|uniref:hypothetical protein n=1 Tax=Neobacillus jeddahensis TaxID=1461580 RepID=UPI00058EDDD1|nr:hypothetical protein [Neobacillus jeddahensis]